MAGRFTFASCFLEDCCCRCASWWQVTQSKDASQVAPYVNVLTDSELTGFVALIEVLFRAAAQVFDSC